MNEIDREIRNKIDGMMPLLRDAFFDDYAEVAVNAKRMGREESWKLAKKIFEMRIDDFYEVFKTKIIGDVFRNYTVHQAKAMIEEWEQRNHEKKEEPAEAPAEEKEEKAAGDG